MGKGLARQRTSFVTSCAPGDTVQLFRSICKVRCPRGKIKNSSVLIFYFYIPYCSQFFCDDVDCCCCLPRFNVPKELIFECLSSRCPRPFDKPVVEHRLVTHRGSNPGVHMIDRSTTRYTTEVSLLTDS